MNSLVFFAEVQIAVLLVLNLPWQGFPATCWVGHCCVCSPLLFASERLCDLLGDSPTYSKQRLNEISSSWWPTSCVAWKPKMHKWPWCHAEWRLLEFVYGLLLGNCGYQTDRKKDLWPMQNHTLLAILLRNKIKNYKHVSLTFHNYYLSVVVEEDPTWPYILAGSLVVVLLVAVLVGFLLWQRYEY